MAPPARGDFSDVRTTADKHQASRQPRPRRHHLVSGRSGLFAQGEVSDIRLDVAGYRHWLEFKRSKAYTVDNVETLSTGA